MVVAELLEFLWLQRLGDGCFNFSFYCYARDAGAAVLGNEAHRVFDQVVRDAGLKSVFASGNGGHGSVLESPFAEAGELFVDFFINLVVKYFFDECHVVKQDCALYKNVVRNYLSCLSFSVCAISDCTSLSSDSAMILMSCSNVVVGSHPRIALAKVASPRRSLTS